MFKIGEFFKKSLSSTSSKISETINKALNAKKLSNEDLEDLKDSLIMADFGVELSELIINKIVNHKFLNGETESKIEIAKIISNIITEAVGEDNDINIVSDKLNIILMSGVNGSGKTTTVAKLANYYLKKGKKVKIVACDTYRAAAIDQLSEWAMKIDSSILYKEDNKDPASIVYKAILESYKDMTEILIIDTAGRLQNNKNLMDELQKIVTVINKLGGDKITFSSVLVLDSNVGQNAISQLENYKKIANINSIIVTKIDGTAKAGIVVNLIHKYKVPVILLTLGEGINDLEKFNPDLFSKSIIGI